MPDPTPTPDTLRAAIERARDEVVRLCDPHEHWRMSIPANPRRDSDLILMDALDAALAASPAPTDSPDEPCADCGHPREDHSQGDPPDYSCWHVYVSDPGGCDCEHYARPAAVTAPRAHRQGDPHDPAGCTACQDSGARLTASSHGFPRSVADALRAVDEGWSGGWPAEVLAAEYARPAAVTAPREDERPRHMRPHRWAHTCGERTEGTDDPWCNACRWRAVGRLSPDPRLAAAAPAVERATPDPNTDWHDPTHGQIDRDIQDQVAEMQPTSLGQRVAIERTLQDRRDREAGRG